jgi:hypothetical protein
MKTDPTKLMFNAEQGGGAAVADAPAELPSGIPDVNAIKNEQSALLAKAFGEEPRAQRQERSPIKQDKKPVAAPQTAPEKKAEAVAPAAPKKETIFDRVAPETAPVEPVADFDPFAGVKDGDWKAAKEAAKRRESEVRQQLAERESRLKKLEDEITPYRQKAPDVQEIDKLRREHKEFSDRIAVLDYQSHPDYKRQFVEPKQKLVAQANEILAYNNIEGVDLISLASKPRPEMLKAFGDIQSKLTPLEAGEVHLALREIQKLNEAEKGAINGHSNLSEALRRESELKQRRAFEAASQENSSWVAKPYSIPEGIDPGEAESLRSFNKAIENIRPTAEKYAFAPGDEKLAGSLAVKAAQFDFYTQHAIPRMVKDYQAAKGLIEELTSRVKELEASRPGGDFSGGSSGGSVKGAEETLSINDLVKRTYGR